MLHSQDKYSFWRQGPEPITWAILLVIAEVIPEETKTQTVSSGVENDVNTSN